MVFDLMEELNTPTILENIINTDETLERIVLVIKDLFFGVDCKPFSKFCLSNITSNESGYTFAWDTRSESSVCPRCKTESYRKRGTYKAHNVIGEEILGRTVTHALRKAQYICDVCKANGGPESFVEDISDICGRQRKTTLQLDEKIVNEAIYRSANGLANDYKGRIDISRETILKRLKEAGAMVTEKNLTETEKVKVLSVDDNNGRKGNSSTANTIIIDAENHIILAVVEGADSEKAEQVFKRFTEAQGLSRDRACAYSKAGDSCQLEQYADLFHLVTNAHDAVKDVISKELPYNIYVREGDGWVDVATAGASKSEAPETVYITTLSDEDIDERVKYAQLSAQQEKKYRSVIEILRLYDQGLSTKEIRNRMDLTQANQITLLRDAPNVIDMVEKKIDKSFENEKRTFQQQFMSKKPRPSSESIVAPYADTVMRMVKEGCNHRSIHPVITEMGYTGSSNAIYQYILKRRVEESATSEQSLDNCPQRPLPVSLQRITKNTVYRLILHEVSEQRKDNNEDSEPIELPAETQSEEAVSDETVSNERKSAFYSDEIADIIMKTEKEKASKKN